LDEELKKEIEELKKEDKKKEEVSDEEKNQEDLSHESKKEVPKKEQGVKKSFFKTQFKSLNFYLKLCGIIFAFLGIVVGVLVLNNFLSKTNLKLVKKQATQTKETELSLKNEEEKIYPEKEVISVVNLPTSKEEENKEEENKKKYYTVTIFPLIVPISEKVFLKVQVTLFYFNYQDIVLCQKHLFWYKEFFYTFLKKVPSDVWYDSNKIKEISEKALVSLKKSNITPVPAKIKIDGAILKA